MKFDVNLSILFTELPLLERPAAAAAAGFTAVELWWPFDTAVPADRDVDALLRALDDAGVDLVGLNFDAGDLPAGDRGFVSVPEQSDRFRANIDVAVGIAERAGCRVLNALYGNRVDGVDPARQDDLALENLGLAAAAARRAGAQVVIEALNGVESPRYPLQRTADVLGLLERVRAATGAELGYLYDVYHLQRGEGDLIATIDRHADRFAHVQIADAPGRNQPGTGEIAFERVLPALTASGYRGYVGLEYRPTGASADSFDWLQPGLRPARGR